MLVFGLFRLQMRDCHEPKETPLNKRFGGRIPPCVEIRIDMFLGLSRKGVYGIQDASTWILEPSLPYQIVCTSHPRKDDRNR